MPAAVAAPAVLRAGEGQQQAAVEIDSRRELFVDSFLIERLTGDAERRLHYLVPQDVALRCDALWEGSGSNYVIVFRDGERFRMYYRGAQLSVENGKLVKPHAQVTCYAESRDGITWTKPKLGLFAWNGPKENNTVWTEGWATHNFTPFEGTRPGVSDNERYKALAYAPHGAGRWQRSPRRTGSAGGYFTKGRC